MRGAQAAWRKKGGTALGRQLSPRTSGEPGRRRPFAGGAPSAPLLRTVRADHDDHRRVPRERLVARVGWLGLAYVESPGHGGPAARASLAYMTTEVVRCSAAFVTLPCGTSSKGASPTQVEREGHPPSRGRAQPSSLHAGAETLPLLEADTAPGVGAPSRPPRRAPRSLRCVVTGFCRRRQSRPHSRRPRAPDSRRRQARSGSRRSRGRRQGRRREPPPSRERRTPPSARLRS
jgi:hypothetical protein